MCNICNAPKLADLEVRTGYGGGYMDREDVRFLILQTNSLKNILRLNTYKETMMMRNSMNLGGRRNGTKGLEEKTRLEIPHLIT